MEHGCESMENMIMDSLINITTQSDENVHGIQLSDPAQNRQFHGIKLQQIWIFEFLLYKLSLKDS